MRSVVLALLGLGLLALPVWAEGGPGQRIEAEDPAGDATYQGVPMDFVDLLAARVGLAVGNLTVELEVADSAFVQQSIAVPAGTGWEYWVELRYRDDLFHLVIDPGLGSFPNPDDPGQFVDTTLVHTFRWEESSSLWTKTHEATGTGIGNLWTGTFPLASLQASDGFVPGPGEPIRIIEAVAYFDEGAGSPHDFPRGNANIPQQMLLVQDRAAFPADAVLSVLGASEQTGLSLSTPRPVRFSNGEATTYHWPVAVSNLGSTQVEVVFESEAPAEVEVRLPGAARIEPGASAVVDVFATVPFTHEHGGERSIVIQALSGGKQTVLPLAIRYLAIAQPAGHHPNLFMHADNPGGGDAGLQWMDTVEVPERFHDDRMALGTMTCYPDDVDVDGQATTGARFVLDPALLIGMDARVEEPARFKGTLDLASPSVGGRFVFDIVLYDSLSADSGMAVQNGNALPGIAVVAGTTGQVPIEVEIPLSAELDDLPPGDGRNLALRMAFCSDSVAPPSAPRLKDALLHGAFLQMPLNEYHDSIPLDAGSGPTLSTEQAARFAAPGSTMVWGIQVDGAASAYKLDLFGVSKSAARLDKGTIEAGQTATVQLDVPAEASDLDILEVIVSAHAEGDALASSAIRLTVQVDSTLPVETAQTDANAQESPQTPMGSLLAVLVVLAALRASRRRA